jgi:nucleoside-diphosphate-sugar epimerase
MSAIGTVLITGASGNLGGKLRQHLTGRYDLRLLDLDPRGDAAVLRADFSRWDAAWVQAFHGVDVVVHLAADPRADQTWPNIIGPNIDGVANVLQACVQQGVRRVVFASSNHVLGGYKDDPQPQRLTPDTPPRPGTHYLIDGESRDSSAYGASKLFGERLGKCYSENQGLSFLAVRIGWVRRGDNRAKDLPPQREAWFRMMWLSNRDFCHLVECCIRADPGLRFAILHGMSANTGSRWDLEATRQLVGYAPQDDVTRGGG